MAEQGSYLDGRVVVVTGAGGGFGRLVARGAAARGAHVVAGDVDQVALEETAVADGEITTVVADVTDRSAMRAFADAAVDAYGAIDIMVNNAGVMPLAFFADHEAAAEAWDRCIDINLKGVVNGITAVHDQMMRQGRGHIVNIASIYGNQPVVGAAVYGATKAAVIFVSEALRQESQGKIKVTVVRPTGVPGTGLGAGVINMDALRGILGHNEGAFFEAMGALSSDEPPAALTDVDGVRYAQLAPALLADQILYAIDQPWGVSISDITVRASGDHYVI